MDLSVDAKKDDHDDTENSGKDDSAALVRDLPGKSSQSQKAAGMRPTHGQSQKVVRKATTLQDEDSATFESKGKGGKKEGRRADKKEEKKKEDHKDAKHAGKKEAAPGDEKHEDATKKLESLIKKVDSS